MKITPLLHNANEELYSIFNNPDDYFNDARKLINDFALITEISNTIAFIENDNNRMEERYEKILCTYTNGVAAIEKDTIPNLSTKQHRGNEGEGQFHITNRNIDWHLNSKYFCGWLSYKDLNKLLDNGSNENKI